MCAQPNSSTISWQEASSLLEEKDEPVTTEFLVREHARFVFKVAYGVLRNSHDAEDVVQEVFLRVHRAGTRDVRHLRGWLARIAFRLAIDRVRTPQPAELNDAELQADGPSAEQVASERQQVERTQRMIAALPEDLRYPLVLSAIEELTSAQIAEILKISEATVRGRIFRARQLLKEKLAATAGKRT